MPMLFLGHTKSNFDMMLSWLTTNDLKTSFGKQFNNYVSLIRNLQIYKYFNAHSRSTSSWGTGVWASEKDVFRARTIKF
jgi:hypothetical protein